MSTELLVLTTNPGFEKSKKKYDTPTSPWVHDHAFWRGRFRTQRQFKALFWELAQISGAKNSGDAEKTAKDFAETKAIAASFVPFRTPRADKITKEMRQFSRARLWPEIMNVWTPRYIIAIGKVPYDFMRESLELSGYKELMPEQQMPLQRTCRRRSVCNRWVQLQNGSNMVTLVYFLHFAEYRHFPKAFPDNYAEDSEGRNFLRKIFNHSGS